VATAGAAAAAAARGRLAKARLFPRPVRREHGELPEDVPRAAVRARRRVGVHTDKLLEVRLALHARVLVNGHLRILPRRTERPTPKGGRPA
jgi:hypothetical protein